MASCSIRWCGKNSKKSNYKTDGITFHRFPQEAGIKEKWIDYTKRENWFPSNYSVICSRHFTEDCFYTMKNRRRLFGAAIPTMHLPVVSNTAVTSDCAPEDLNTLPSSSSQNEPILITPKATDPETPSQLHSPAKKRLPLSPCKNEPILTTPKATDPETSPFHSPTKKRLCRRILELSKKVKQKNKTIKDLRDKVRYHKKKVASLKLILNEIKKSLINAEDADCLNKIGFRKEII